MRTGEGLRVLHRENLRRTARVPTWLPRAETEKRPEVPSGIKTSKGA
jgi:hypothetical protein